MTDFIPTRLDDSISVTHLVTLHNFKYTPDFLFTGESHNFWELVFIRTGSVGVMAGSTGYTLHEGEAIFHQPCEYHNIWANGDVADVVIISFVCESPAMRFFEKRMLTLSHDEAKTVDMLLRLGEATFSEPPDIIYQKHLSEKADAPFGAKQLLRINLESLLISMIRNGATINKTERKSKSAGTKNDKLIADAIIKTLTENLHSSLTLDDVCADVCFSKSHLKNLFKKNTGYSIMDYYTHLKIERAKILIDAGEKSFSDIAALLDFGSIHYFSRVFKRKTGLSPTEYKNRS